MKDPNQTSVLIPMHETLTRRSLRRKTYLVAGLLLANACVAVSPQAIAQCQQGCDATHFNAYLGDSALINNTSGADDVAIGESALRYNSTGTQDTGVGAFALTANTIGVNDTAIGYAAMNVGAGADNTAVGVYSLLTCSGNSNTATGSNAMGEGNVTGNNNTADGYKALFNSGSGNNNVAMGYETLYSNTTGGSNTASGYLALFFNSSGNFNTATGRGALYKNMASNNVATGYQSLNNNTSGTFNTAVGTKALAANTTASYNTAVGYQALNTTTGQENTALGANALFGATGSNNIAVGSAAGSFVTSGNFNIEIGSVGGTDSNTIRLGTVGQQTSAYIAGIYGVTVAGGIGVIVDSSGHLGTSTSSARYKDNIQPMDKASEAILSLQPVTFRYKKELDPKAIPQFGLIAEQVEKVNPNLVARDDQGKPYSVRYEAVNAMLLNEFLKEHRKVEGLQATASQQQATNTAQQREIDELRSALKAQAAQIQKVSAQLAIDKPGSRVVANEQ
jgi:trimeric autotransporter adhesin